MIQSQRSSRTTHRKERNKASFLTQSYHIDLEYLAYSRGVKWTTFHIFLVCFYFLFEAWKLQFPIENAWITTITVFKVFFQRSTEKRKSHGFLTTQIQHFLVNYLCSLASFSFKLAFPTNAKSHTPLNVCASGREMEKRGWKQEREIVLNIKTVKHINEAKEREILQAECWGWFQPPKFSPHEFANCERKISISIPPSDIHYKRLKPTITSHFYNPLFHSSPLCLFDKCVEKRGRLEEKSWKGNV